MFFFLKVGDALAPFAQAFLKDHQSHDAFLTCAS
jgi:hypothetical protein